MLSISNIIGKFIKNSSQRELDSLKNIVKKIDAQESQVKELSDESFFKIVGFPPARFARRVRSVNT